MRKVWKLIVMKEMIRNKTKAPKNRNHPTLIL